MSSKIIKIIAVILLTLFAGGLYLLTLRGSSGNPDAIALSKQEGATQAFELSPERGRFAHIVALAETKEYSLSQGLADFVYPDVGWYDGRFYSFFAPGLAYMAVPFYLIGMHFNLAQVFTFGFISFISILSLLMVYIIARSILKLPNWTALTSAIIFGFGSTAWSYAVTLYQHQLTTFFILSTFYATWKYAQKAKFSWLWACWVWLGYGLALTIDYPNALLLAPVMIYFFVSAISIERLETKTKIGLRTSFALTAIFFVIVSGLHIAHNQKEFGSWKRLSGSIVSYKTIKAKGLEGQPAPVIAQAISQIQDKKSNVVGFFTEENTSNSFGTLMFSKDRGLLFYGPIFIFGLLGMLLALGSITLEIAVLIALVLTNIFLYSSWGDPWGGWAYGTRYLIPSMSVLSLFAGLWFTKSPKAWISRLVAIPLFAYSSAVALVGVLTTNAVPPRVEADYLHMKYNYLYNIDFLKAGKSGSFIFNTYLGKYLSLMQYFEIIYVLVLVAFISVILVGPLLKKKAHV